MKKQEKTHTRWQLCLSLAESEKEEIIAISRRYGTTYPALVAALLRGVLEKQLAEDLLSDTELPTRYQRRRALSSKQVLDRLGLKNHAKAEPHVDAEQPDASTEQQLAMQRQRAFRELCLMWELPGRNLDEECDGALGRWVAEWGDLSPAEGRQLREADEKRQAAYRQWRDEVKRLEEYQAQLQRQIAEATPRHKPVLKRQRESIAAELEAFREKVRWDQRHFAEPGNE